MKTITPFGDHGLVVAYVQDGQGRRLVACVADRWNSPAAVGRPVE